MKKFIALALAAAGCALATGAAQAHSNVYWSIGITSGGPVYVEPAPVYMPAPVVVAPAPPVYVPAPVYAPAPVYVAPSPVYYVPRRVHYRPVPVYAPRPVVMRPADFVNGVRYDGRWNDQRRYRHD